MLDTWIIESNHPCIQLSMHPIINEVLELNIMYLHLKGVVSSYPSIQMNRKSLIANLGIFSCIQRSKYLVVLRSICFQREEIWIQSSMYPKGLGSIPFESYIILLNPIIQISSCKLYSLIFLRRNDRMNPIFYVSFLFAKFWIEVSIWLLLSCPVDALTLRAPIELSCRCYEPRAVLIWGSWCSFH